MSYAPNGSELLLKTADAIEDRRAGAFKKDAATSRRRPAKTSSSDPQFPPIIVHSHLCWDWVWQRPQQFVSRLSRRRNILFIETVAPDPQLSSPTARFYSPESFPNLTVLRIQFPLWRWSDGAFVDRERRRLVKEFLRGPGAGSFEKPIQWFYDPMAVTAFGGQLDEVLTVYDCMDELSQFRGAPPDIKLREAKLLELADVVFTGGWKLWQTKRAANNNCHFHGCGVDAEHFAKARAAGTVVPADLAALPGPLLGYFGVVDERLDYDLIARLADADPKWSIAIIGPVLKVEPNALPRRPNLHWLGRRDYDQLPACCKAFDVCLMPFALNEATEFINPTKALEYMATGRPIVSSAVPDVLRNFGDVVQIARDPDAFIELCRTAASAPDRRIIDRGLRMAAGNSWDSVVGELEQHIEQALVKKRATWAVA